MADRQTTPRRAIVVGGASGIGAAITEVLDYRGWEVVILDLAEPVNPPEKVRWILADVTSPEFATGVDDAVSLLGGLDGAVNCAGIGGPDAGVEDYPLEAWDTVLSVNVTGTLRGMQAQIPHLGRGGSIVNVSSVTGHRGVRNACAYVAAKHALEGLTQSAALELADRGIRVNTVVPGFIETPLLRARRDEAQLGAIAARHPMGRLGQPEEVSEAVEFLLAERSSFITGTALRTDGGYLSA